MKKLAILASGSGSNAENIIEFFKDSTAVEVSLIATNRRKAGVLERAARLQVPALVFNRADLEHGQLEKVLLDNSIDYVILAGFLMKVPESMIAAFPDKIINIHPALLPKYGGKGMYGHHVHQAVKDNNESETGITIHLVNEEYDKGRILFQAQVHLSSEDSVEDIASKVHQLEYKHFPKTIQSYIQ
ncbi:MAG: phosphoribosylglycinamide formyltransferase [Flavobacteriales bacterium]|nr:phosphoribosylglycinamide formyltransferase [Flavobacteriales bacterium]